jgi:alpha-tubulin suppressor-like RCC1 family protein
MNARRYGYWTAAAVLLLMLAALFGIGGLTNATESAAHTTRAQMTATETEMPDNRLSSNSNSPTIAAGGNHTCALTEAGGVLCWGYNYYGQLGDGTSGEYDDISTTPVQVSGLQSGVTALAAGYNHTCALTDAGAPPLALEHGHHYLRCT